MADIGPELYHRIETEFNSKASFDIEIQNFIKQMIEGKAGLEDVHTYTERLGEILSDVLLNNLTEDILPNGQLYWNIAERTIRPMLEDVHGLTNDAAATVQKYIDAAEGIGLNAVKSEFPRDRVHGLIDKTVTAESYEAMKGWLGEPIINTAESFFDDYIQTNVEFRFKSGMSPKIVRTLGRSEQRKARTGRKYNIPCQWCRELAGEYVYGYEPEDVYRRHRGCRCVVTFQNGKERQNVWSKEIWKAGEEILTSRRNYGFNETLTPEKRLQKLPQGENVTGEYIREAKQGIGSVDRENGFKEKKHEKEMQNADWLLNTFGGKILLLNDTGGESKSDYLWKDKLWDLKSITSSSYGTIDKRIKHGMEQITLNPGGLLLDITESKLDIEEMEKMLKKSAMTRVKTTADFIIRKDNAYKVIRIKRE